MEINKTIEGRIVKTSPSTAGFNLSPATRHHFNIEPGDTVIFEIKDVIKAPQIPADAVVGKASAGQKAGFDLLKQPSDGMSREGFEPPISLLYRSGSAGIGYLAIEDVMVFR